MSHQENFCVICPARGGSPLCRPHLRQSRGLCHGEREFEIINGGNFTSFHHFSVLKVANSCFYCRKRLYTSRNSNPYALWFSLPRKFPLRIRLGHQRKKNAILVTRQTVPTFLWSLSSAIPRQRLQKLLRLATDHSVKITWKWAEK